MQNKVVTKTCKECGHVGEAAIFHGRLCPSCRRRQRQEHYERNKEDLKKIKLIYYQNNREELVKKKKVYYENNKEVVNQNYRKYENKRMKSDPIFYLRKLVSSAIRRNMKKRHISKSNKSVSNYLNYSFLELRAHLEKQFEPWMNWINYKMYNPTTWDDNDPNTWTWNIDHIIPQADLPYTSMEDENFQKCWALENLRPLSAKRNVFDGARRVRHRGSK